jgi:hypothetical protein
MMPAADDDNNTTTTPTVVEPEEGKDASRISLEENLQEVKRQNAALQDEHSKLHHTLSTLQEENVKLTEDNHDLSAQNESYLQMVSGMRYPSLLQAKAKVPSSDSSTGIPPNNNNNNNTSSSSSSSSTKEELQQTIDDLTQRVMILVQEKLNILNLVEALEHQFLGVEVNEEDTHQDDDPNQNNRTRQHQGSSWLGGVLLGSTNNNNKSTNNNKNTKNEEMKRVSPQDEAIKAALARKRDSSITGRISGIFDQGESMDMKHELQAFKRRSSASKSSARRSIPEHRSSEDISIQEDEVVVDGGGVGFDRHETLDRESWMAQANDSLNESMLNSMGGDGTGEGTNQAKFLVSAIKNKQQSTWGRISGLIVGGSPAESSRYKDVDVNSKLKRMSNLSAASSTEEDTKRLSSRDSSSLVGLQLGESMGSMPEGRDPQQQ